jgi:hypothetical protein
VSERGYRHRAAVAAAIGVLLALVLALAWTRGRTGRVTLPQPLTIRVEARDLAYRAWKGADVRGRVLLWFDRYPHLDLDWYRYRDGEQPTAANALDFAVFDGIVRKIFLVVPEEEWDEIRRNELAYQGFRRPVGAERVLQLRVNDLSGIPLVAATPSSLPALDEEVLVYVNAALHDPGEVARVLAGRNIRADLTVVVGEGGVR